MDDTSPTPSAPPERSSGATCRRRQIIGGAVVAAVVVAAGIGIAVASSSNSHHNAASAVTAHAGPAAGNAIRPAAGSGSSTTSGKTPGSQGQGGSSGGTGRSATSPPVTDSSGHVVRTTTTTVRPGSWTTLPHQGGTKSTLPPDEIPPAIQQAYVQGFQNECHALWSQAGPSGELWDADSLSDPPHTIDECLSALDPTDAGIWFQYTPAEARAGGQNDADTVADGMTVGNRFQNSSGLVIYIPQD